MNFKEFILKLQSLPETKKKIILWTIVIIIGFFMGFFWVRGAVHNFSQFLEPKK